MKKEERFCANAACRKPLDENAHGKRIYCNAKCRIAAHRSANEENTTTPSDPTIAQIKAILLRHVDRASVVSLCREILGLPSEMAIQDRVVSSRYDRSIRIPTLTPHLDETLPEAPKYVDPRPILYPMADKTKQMVEPEFGTTAWYLRHGDTLQ